MKDCTKWLDYLVNDIRCVRGCACSLVLLGLMAAIILILSYPPFGEWHLLLMIATLVMGGDLLYHTCLRRLPAWMLLARRFRRVKPAEVTSFTVVRYDSDLYLADLVQEHYYLKVANGRPVDVQPLMMLGRRLTTLVEANRQTLAANPEFSTNDDSDPLEICLPDRRTSLLSGALSVDLALASGTKKRLALENDRQHRQEAAAAARQQAIDEAIVRAQTVDLTVPETALSRLPGDGPPADNNSISLAGES